MPATHALAPHDDGRMYPAELLDQYRGRDGSWRVVVRYSTEPGPRICGRSRPTAAARSPTDEQWRDVEQP
jgi:hypothetical protein